MHLLTVRTPFVIDQRTHDLVVKKLSRVASPRCVGDAVEERVPHANVVGDTPTVAVGAHRELGRIPVTDGVAMVTFSQSV